MTVILNFQDHPIYVHEPFDLCLIRFVDTIRYLFIFPIGPY